MSGWNSARNKLTGVRQRAGVGISSRLPLVGLMGIALLTFKVVYCQAQMPPQPGTEAPQVNSSATQNLGEQIRQFERLVKEHPQAPELWSNLGAVRAMSGDCEGALPALKRAQSLNPDLYNPWFFAGYCYFALHQDERALTSIERATHLNARDPNAWFLEGQIKSALGDLGGSLQAVARAQLQGESRAEAYYLAGKDSLDMASELFSQVMTSQPSPGIYSLLLGGQRDAAMGVLDSAIQQYEQALKTEPRRSDLLFALGSAYLEKGEFAAAEGAFRKCLQSAPDSRWARLRLALSIAKQSRNDEAAQLLRSIRPDNLELISEFEDFLSCASLMNSPDSLKTALARAREKFPDEDDWNSWEDKLKDGTSGNGQNEAAPLKQSSLSGVGLSFRFFLTANTSGSDFFKEIFPGPSAYERFRSDYLGGRWMAAAGVLAPLLERKTQTSEPARAFALGEILQSLSYEFYRQLGREFPDSYPAMKVAAENLQLAGQTDKALEVYEGIIEKDGPSPEILREMARLNWTDHRWEKALKSLEPLAQIDPYDPTIFVNLGRIYLYEQKTADAATAFRRAIQIEPGMAEAHLGMGKVFREEGDFPSAVRELKLAIQINPANPRSHYVLAQVYSRLGEKTLAAEEMSAFQRLGAGAHSEARPRDESLVPLE